MAKIALKYMVCYDTQEWPRDEIDLQLDGTNAYVEYRVSVGDILQINQVRNMSGSSDVLRLFEIDLFRDDFLGRHTVYASEAGLGERTANFTRAGAHYSLAYEVLA
jgi:hypothetical protein